MQGRICLQFIVTVVLFALLSGNTQAQQSLEPLREQGKVLRSLLQQTALQAKNPHTVGAPAHDASKVRANLVKLEGDFLAYLAKSKDIINEVEVSLEDKAKFLAFYFTQFSIFIQVRALLGKKEFPINLEWQRPYSFPLNLDRVEELSHGGALKIQIDLQSPMVIDRIEGEVAYLRLSALHVSSLEQEALKNATDKQSYFTLVRYLLMLWFNDKWSDVTKYFSFQEAFPEIPQHMIDEFEGFNTLKDISKRTKTVAKEASFRSQLIENIDMIEKPFVTDAFVQDLINIVIPEQHHEQYFKIYKSSFKQAEKVDMKEAFKVLVISDYRSFSQLDSSQLSSHLKSQYIKAKVGVVESLLPDPEKLPEPAQVEIEKLLTLRTQQFQVEVTDEDILSWIEKAEVEEKTPAQNLQVYTQKLIELSKAYQKKRELSDDDLKMDLITLDVSLEADYIAMGLSESSAARKAMIISGGTYPVAFSIFHGLVKSLKKRLGSEVSDDSSNRLSTRAKQGAARRAEKDYQDLLKIGSLFFGYDESKRDFNAAQVEQLLPAGLLEEKKETYRANLRWKLFQFNQQGKEDLDPTKVDTPVMSDLPLSNTQKENYKTTMRIQMLGAFPVLLVGEGTDLFYKELIDVETKDVTAVEYKLAVLKVRASLYTVRENILKKVSKISDATNIEDLRVVVSKSPLLNLLIQNYPTFAQHHEDLKKLVNSPSFFQLTWDEMHHSLTSTGFMFLIAHWVIKFVPGVASHPVSRAVDHAIHPYLAYFLIPAFGMIIANGAMTNPWNGTIADKGYENEELKEYFLTSTEGESLIDFFIVSREVNATAAAKFSWWMERSMEAMFFIGIPILGRPIRRFIGNVKSGRYEKLFKQVGFSKGNYRWNKADIDEMAKSTIESINGQPTAARAIEVGSNGKVKVVKKPLESVEGELSDTTKQVAIKQVQKAQAKLLKILAKRQKAADRAIRHYSAEFEALELEPGTWDPLQIINAVERINLRTGSAIESKQDLFRAMLGGKKVDQVALDATKKLEEAVNAARELLAYIRKPFAMIKNDSALAALERKFIFDKDISRFNTAKETQGLRIVEDGMARYGEWEFDIDPVLKKNVVEFEGTDMTAVTYERIVPYMPRIFRLSNMFKWPKWILRHGKDALSDEAVSWRDFFKARFSRKNGQNVHTPPEPEAPGFEGASGPEAKAAGGGQ